jgi:hypothetical protein
MKGNPRPQLVEHEDPVDANALRSSVSSQTAPGFSGSRTGTRLGVDVE